MERPTKIKFHNFNLPSSYQAGLRKIADQQRMARMLQEQAQAPTERFSYKGIEAHTPATAGLAKILQGLTGTYLEGKARDEEEALGKKYQTESSDLLRQAFEAGSGTPAVPGTHVPGTEAVYDEELGLDQLHSAKAAQTVGGTAAVPGNPQRMAQLLMQNPRPDIQQLGADQMRKNMESQAFMNAGMGTGAPGGGKMPAGTFGGPAGGQAMAVWLQIDPTGKQYINQLATDKQNQEKINFEERQLNQKITEWTGLSAAQKRQLESRGIQDRIAQARATDEGLNVGGPSSTGVAAAPTDTDLSPAQKREATAARALQQEQNTKSMDAYLAASRALIEALANTQGGPIAGNLPPVTAEAQNAVNAIAAMAPILKQLFRSAGEGTFTDKDQATLMEMLPSRTALPGVARKAFDNLDRIIAAKLGLSVPVRSWAEPDTPPAPASQPLQWARNTDTNQLIYSADGGKTWNPAGSN